MLTENQLQKLEPYTKHQRYGKLAKNAINTWIRINPAVSMYGVYYNYDTGCYQCYEYCENTRGCCLIGASLCNKSFAEEPITTKMATRIIYDLEIDEPESIIRGFDDSIYIFHPDFRYWNKNAYNFGFEIGKIVFDKNGSRAHQTT